MIERAIYAMLLPKKHMRRGPKADAMQRCVSQKMVSEKMSNVFDT